MRAGTIRVEPAVKIGERLPSTEILVIGIGNEYAHDDAAGLLVARKLKEKIRDNTAIIESRGDGASLIDAWKRGAAAIVIDAVRSGSEPGRAFRFDASRRPLPAQPFRGSTHAFGLYEAVELSRSLNQLPQRFIVYGIEGQSFMAGSSVSPAVTHAVAEVTESVLGELEALRRLLP